MGKICGIIILSLFVVAQSAFGVAQVSTSTISSGQVWTVPQWNTGLNLAENWLNSNLLAGGNTFTVAGGESLDVQGTAKFDTSRFTGFIDLATHISPRADRLYRIGVPTRLLAGVYTDTADAQHAVLDTLVVAFIDTTNSTAKISRGMIQTNAIDSTKILSVSWSDIPNPMPDSTVWTTASGRNVVIGSKTSGNLITVKRDISGQGNQWALSMNNNTGNDASFAVMNISGANVPGLLITRNENSVILVGNSGVNPTTPTGDETIMVWSEDNDTAINVKFNETQGNANGTVMDVRSTDGSEGGITLAAGGAITYGGYTLVHYGQFASPDDSIETGMLVSAAGAFTGLHPKIRRTNGREDKAVYGVLGRKVAVKTPQWARDSIAVGAKVDSLKYYSRNYSDADPALDQWEVFSAGVGKIYVTDTGGDIAIGDLLSPSTRNGYAERQTVNNMGVTAEDIWRAKTVMKSAVAVTWASETTDPAKGFKWKFIRCFK